jgi:YVTN family beta-propeller protein
MAHRPILKRGIGVLIWVAGCWFAMASYVGVCFAGQEDVSSNKTQAIESTNKNSPSEFRVEKEGLLIEVEIGSENSANGRASPVEGREENVRFLIKDSSTGAPVRGLFPASWMDRRSAETKELSCKDKIGSFLQARLAFRPTNDLNSWYLLAMNDKASISIIDPLVETGSSQMLLDLVLLESPGESWVLDKFQDKLFVSLPGSGKIAVIDTSTWDVTQNIDVGPNPIQVAFQPDYKYLWVGIDGAIKEGDPRGGIAVIESKTEQVVTQIITGPGHHEIAFSADSHYALITNEADGTVSVIDVWKLNKIKDIKLGQSASSVTYSSTANAFYITNPIDGKIHIVDGETQNLTASVAIPKDSNQIEFAPDGRWGFITNPTEQKVMIFDASANRLAHSFEIKKGPYHIVFSETYAFVQAMGSATISIIERSALDSHGVIAVTEIPIGKLGEKSIRVARAKALAVTPEKSSIVIANPSDTSIYYYMEGMNAPMGNFGNFRRRPKGVLTVDKGLRETSPGVYEASVKFQDPGVYDVAFLLDNPRLTHCFTTRVAEDPIRQAERKKSIRLTLVSDEDTVIAGEPTDVRIKLTAGKVDSPVEDVKDLMVLAMAMNNWQNRVYAKSVGNGEYLAKISFPRPGVYFVFFSSRSLQVNRNKLPRLVLHAKNKSRTKNSALQNNPSSRREKP